VTRAALLVVLSGMAWAQTARAAEAPHGKVPGFVARASLGPGVFSSQSGGDTDTRRYLGTTLSFGLELGGRLGRNFAFGGAYLRDQVYGLAVRDSSSVVQPPSVKHLSFALNLYALFGDVILPFSGPELHLIGFAGYSALNVSGHANAENVDAPGGPAFGCAVSGQLPVAGAFRLGLTARYIYAPLHVDENMGTGVSVQVPALLVTVGYD
jgi:hypothetical protein